MGSARIRLKVAADGLSVSADVAPGPAEGLDQLRAALAAARVVYVVDPSEITKLATSLADPKFSTSNHVIGRGLAPVPGKDGFFEPVFHVGIQPGHIGADGMMDFHDRELLKAFAEGDFIGTLHRPTPGVAGRRVDGTEIKVPPVRPSKLRVGPGVRLDGSGRAYAARLGVLLYNAEQSIDLSAQHIHQGDVDYRSGNLAMQGALVVRGNVQRLFSVSSSGDLEIQGGIDGGSAFAGTNMRVRGGVRGGETGILAAEHDIAVHHAEAAHIVCGGLLKLESAINSQLSANKIQIARTVRGGSVEAETSVVVQQAGGPSAAATTLAAGVPLERPVLEVRRAIDAAKVQRGLQHRAGGVRDDERGKGGKLGREQAGFAAGELARKAQLADRRTDLLASASVHVIGRAHTGVTIKIGLQSLTIDEPVSNARFSFDPGKRVIRKEGTAR